MLRPLQSSAISSISSKRRGRRSTRTSTCGPFDFSQNTNLYLTTQERTDFGKQSQEMHHYKELFLANGLDMPNQLPDYLPALLELSAALPPEQAGKVLGSIRPRVELLRTRFIEAKLPHAFLLDIVLTETAGLEVKP